MVTPDLVAGVPFLGTGGTLPSNTRSLVGFLMPSVCAGSVQTCITRPAARPARTGVSQGARPRKQGGICGLRPDRPVLEEVRSPGLPYSFRRRWGCGWKDLQHTLPGQYGRPAQTRPLTTLPTPLAQCLHRAPPEPHFPRYPPLFLLFSLMFLICGQVPQGQGLSAPCWAAPAPSTCLRTFALPVSTA